METQRTAVHFVIEKPKHELWIKRKWLYQFGRKKELKLFQQCYKVLEYDRTQLVRELYLLLNSAKKAGMQNAMLKEAGSLLSEVKQSHSNDSRVAVQMGLSLICGETVIENNLQTSVAKSLGINRRRIAMNAIHRAQVLCDKSIGWSPVKWRRSDAISEEHSKLAYDFWASPGISTDLQEIKGILLASVGGQIIIVSTKNISWKKTKMKFTMNSNRNISQQRNIF